VLAGRANWWWPARAHRAPADPLPEQPPDGYGGVRERIVSAPGEGRR